MGQSREDAMRRSAIAKLGCAALALAAPAAAAHAQVVAQQVENVPMPASVDVFNLGFDEIKRYSSVKDFEILGHSYFKVSERTPYAKAQGRSGPELGSGFNTVRVYDGIAYLGGYTSPPTLFAVLIADVRDPRNIKVLSAIPCHPGTRCGYLRVNRAKKILVIGHDSDPRGNPNQPPAGEKAKVGWSFHDVSDPSRPKELGFVAATPDGKTRSEEHTSELQSLRHLVCRLLLEKKKSIQKKCTPIPSERKHHTHISNGRTTQQNTSRQQTTTDTIEKDTRCQTRAHVRRKHRECK